MLVAAESNLRTRRIADVELLQLALDWADLHLDEALPPPVDENEARRRRLADQVGTRMGGEGAQLVLAHCPAELGAVLETTYTGARHLIADALDLRDRLPRLWTTVQDGRVAAWKARRVAAATRALSIRQVAEVDTVVHEVIATLGWTRFEAILDATIKQADPDGARAAEQQAATQRFVAVGRANDHHIRTLIARGTSLDILSFLAAVNRIADLLAVEGDPDPIEVRRSKAVGILARPAYALELLARHQSAERDSAAESEPDPEDDGQLSSPPSSPLLRDGHRCGCAPRLQLTSTSPRPPSPERTRTRSAGSTASARSPRTLSGSGSAEPTSRSRCGPSCCPTRRPSTATRYPERSAMPWRLDIPAASTPGPMRPARPSTSTTPPPTSRPIRVVRHARPVTESSVR